MPDICSASNNKLNVSRAITTHLHRMKERSRVCLDFVSEIVVSVLLGTTHNDTFIKLIHTTKQEVVFSTLRRCQ